VKTLIFICCSTFCTTLLADAYCRSFNSLYELLIRRVGEIERIDKKEGASWVFQIVNFKRDQIVATYSVRETDIKKPGFCFQEFNESNHFIGKSNYCKTLFYVEVKTKRLGNLDFDCSGTFTR